MIDPTAILITYLNSVSAVTALVSDRISSTIRPEDENTLPAIEVALLSGDSNPYVPIIQAPFNIKTWAATGAAAWALWGVVHDALHTLSNETVGSDFIYTSQVEVGGQPLIDPDTGINTVLGIFDLQMRNT